MFSHILLFTALAAVSEAGHPVAAPETSEQQQPAHLQELSRSTCPPLGPEYFFTRNTAYSWTARNCVHKLHLSVDEHGAELTPAPGTGSWKLSVELIGFGRSGMVQEVEVRDMAAIGNRVELRRTQVTEWYVNQAAGLEQGFTIHTRPPASVSDRALVVLDMKVRGGLRRWISSDNMKVLFMTADGDAVVRYADLTVLDANGAVVPAHFSSAGEHLRIEIEDADAVYPLLVDPFITDPSWTAESDEAGAAFGWSVSGAGDVNNDGYDDVIVGAYTYTNDQSNEGRAYLYLGSATGLEETHAWTAEGNQDQGFFAASVAGAGDINGDGYDDVVIGFPSYRNENQEAIGRFVIYRGTGAGTGLSMAPSRVIDGDKHASDFGWSVAGAGDVNGDGYHDVIVGAYLYDNVDVGRGGRAYVYRGGGSGLEAAPAWVYEGDRQNGFVGWSVAGAGDVNGDGYDDVLVGAFGSFTTDTSRDGWAGLFFGGSERPRSTPSWERIGFVPGQEFGYSVAGAGDVNGDGLDDFLIGTSSNEAFLYEGSGFFIGPTPDWDEDGGGGVSQFGFSVAGAGDVNADGYHDVIVGAPSISSLTLPGTAFVYLGSPVGLPAVDSKSLDGHQARSQFGWSVDSAGDVDGSGTDDVIIGSPSFLTALSNRGRADVYNSVTTTEIIDPACGSTIICNGDEYLTVENGTVQISDNPDLLIQAPVRRTGVATDGVTMLLLRKRTGESTTFSLLDGEGLPANGTLGELMHLDGSLPGDSIMVDPVETARGFFVFAVYRAPIDFPGTQPDVENGVTAHLQVENSSDTEDLPLLLEPPPLILVHGLWSNGQGAWGEFARYLENRGWDICDECLVDYGREQSAASFDPLATAEEDRFAVRMLGRSINSSRFRRREQGIAVSQVDVIAHSMGGLVARSRWLHPYRPETFESTYGKGAFHKLITIGTPHKGTPFADWLARNLCERVSLTKDRKGKTVWSILGFLLDPFGSGGDLFGPGLRGLQTSSPDIANLGETQATSRLLVGIAPENSWAESLFEFVTLSIEKEPTTIDALLDPACAATPGSRCDHDTLVPASSQGAGVNILDNEIVGVVHSNFNILPEPSETQSPISPPGQPNAWPELENSLLEPIGTSNPLFGPIARHIPTGTFLPLPIPCVAAASQAATTATVTLAPAAGTIVQPGESILITLQIDGGEPVEGAIFGLGGLSHRIDGPAPYSFSMTVPLERGGIFNIHAFTFGGATEFYEASTYLNVQPSEVPESLTVIPGVIELFEIGEPLLFRVSGSMADGSEIDLTQVASGTSYNLASGTTSVISITGDGLITALGEGEDTLVVTHSTLSVQVPVSVTVTNLPPAFEPVAGVSVDALDALDVSLTASDPDGDNLRLSPVSLPPFATLVDLGGGNGRVELRPTAADVGDHSVVLAVTDYGNPPLNATVSFNVHVRPPCPPAPPAGSPVLSIAKPATLSWTSMPDAQAYDLIVGISSVLHETGGDFSQAVFGCAANDRETTSAGFFQQPPRGEGIWFVVRGVNCVGNGTYDSDDPAQIAPRDALLNAAPGSCP